MPILFLLLFTFATFASVSETGQIASNTISRLSMGAPTFSDNTTYNEYDFCSSPAGLFEKESLDVRIRFDYRKFTEYNANNSDSANRSADEFAIPDILLGKPHLLYVS